MLRGESIFTRLVGSRFLRTCAFVTILSSVAGCPPSGPWVPKSSEFSRILVAQDGSLILLGQAEYRGDAQVNFFAIGNDGNLLGAKVLPTAYEWSVGAAALTANGHVLIGGAQFRFTQSLPALLMRLDMAGNIAWEKRTTETTSNHIIAIMETATGRILTVSAIEDGTHFTAFGSEGTIVRTAEDPAFSCATAAMTDEGDILTLSFNNGTYINEYSESFELKSSIQLITIVPLVDGLLDMTLADNGDIVLTGRTDGIGFADNYLVVRATGDGEILWRRSIDVSGGPADVVAESEDSSLYVGGREGLLKLDADGNEIWQADFIGTIYDLAIAANGTIIAAGRRGVTEDGGSAIRMLLMKFDTDGNLLSDQIFQGATEE